MMGFVLVTIIAALAAFLLGMLWYGPLFGKQWQKLAKLTKKDMKPVPKTMILAVLRQLITALVLVVVFGVGSVFTFTQVWPMVILLWLGLTAMPALSDVLWTKKPLMLYTINVSYELVSFLLMTLIITW